MISVVMPCHNEEGYLEGAVKGTVNELRDRHIEFEVIVAENGSTDDTVREAAALEATYGEIRVLHDPVADYGRALRAGFLAAHGEVVVNFDVDLVDLEFLDQALELIQSGGSDVVVGSKRSPGADDQRAIGRKLVTAVFSTVLRVGFGLRISDTHGLKALRREALIPLVTACRFDKDIFDTELVLRSEKAGLRISEVPVTVTDRRPPRTSIGRRIPRSLVGLARLRLVLWREVRRQ
jgi:glycosyltransferase AglD